MTSPSYFKIGSKGKQWGCNMDPFEMNICLGFSQKLMYCTILLFNIYTVLVPMSAHAFNHKALDKIVF